MALKLGDLANLDKKSKVWLVIIILLLLSIPAGIYLSQTTQIFKPKAAENSLLTNNLIGLKNDIDSNDRRAIKNLFYPLSIAEINNLVQQLSVDERNRLATVVLNITGNGSDQQKNSAKSILLSSLQSILNKSELGFYAEILSYTNVNIEGNGFFGSCNNIWLAPDQINQNAKPDLIRDVLMHEAFHSFNCVNGGPGSTNTNGSHANPLDEGSAIFIFKATFPENRISYELNAGWAETTYGTKNYYRDMGVAGYPRDIPLVIANNPTQKLIDVYTWLSSKDPSKLPWNDLTKLQTCYDKYYKNINRNVDFNLWLIDAAQTSSSLANDASCRVSLPTPTPQTTIISLKINGHQMDISGNTTLNLPLSQNQSNDLLINIVYSDNSTRDFVIKVNQQSVSQSPTSSVEITDQSGSVVKDFYQGQKIILKFSGTGSVIHTVLRSNVNSESEAKQPISAWEAGYQGFADTFGQREAIIPFYLEYLAEGSNKNLEQTHKLLVLPNQITPTPIPTKVIPPPGTPTPAPINVPTNLSASCSNSTVNLSWSAVANTDHYLIRIDDTANGWGGYNIQPGDIIDDNVRQNSYTTSSVQSGHQYQWWVHSVNSSGLISDASQKGIFSCP